ncbi:transporter substrate-binding domain-containing protein [Halobacillus naozhouensis]|uniref:Transporter substrate-binding domain-containing protein n=1 Tax=Halobacillus naozhouensis TaxID=554880 RepID=A0ABY8J159_9BACI|nr:transporter substrate-binding domain-containing protein [Halobacillus naozhouensis]WFT75811.1 transporter substrate-binding domain-containing protein [Halobacillus naozhouensis]
MRKGLLLIFILMFSVVLAACGADENEKGSTESSESAEKNTSDSKWSEIQESGEIVVGTSGTLYPASYYPEGSDKLTGYDVEIMREVAKRLDLELSFEEYGVDGLLSAIKSGRIDMVINDMEVTENRKKEFAFSDPYKYSYSTMIVRESDLSGIETLEDLEGKKHGGGATTVFSKIASHFGAETKTYGNVANDVYLRDVANGRTDFIINDYYLQTLALKALPDIPVKLHPDLKFHPTESAIVMPKDASTLKKKIDETLNEMREDGTLTKISKEFFGGKDASKKPEADVKEIEGLDL